MPAALILAGIAQGIRNMTEPEKWLGFLNTTLGSNLNLYALFRGPPKLQSSSSAISQDRNLSVRQPISPWQVVIGQHRIGGNMDFVFLSTDKRYLHIVVTLACHVSEEIGDLWLDTEIVTPAMLDANGFVISGKYARVDAVPYSEAFSNLNPATVAHTVSSVQSVSSMTGTFPDFTLTPLIDVSPSTPAPGQYKRAGSVFTFNAADQAAIFIDYSESVSVPFCRIKKSLGAEAGQPFADLVAESEGKWTDAHRQTGHTKVYVRFDTSALSAGVPQISSVVKGLKCYDPRTGLTVWTANPALAVLAYLQNVDFGLGAALSETGSAEFIAAANICDERVLLALATATFTADPATDALTLAAGSVLPALGDGVRVASTTTLPAPLAAATTYYAIPTAGLVKLAATYADAIAGTPWVDITTAGSGTHTLTYWDEPRYKANGSFRTSERPVDILGRLLSAMAGNLTQASDTWRVFAGAYEAATLTLDEDDFAGPIQINPLNARNEWANAAKGTFISPASNWQPTDFPAVTSSAYLAEDGGERIWADLDLTGFTTSSAAAQRLAKIELRRRRIALTVIATFKLTAWRAFTGHSVALTFAKYGWTAKEFFIAEAGFVVIQSADGPSLGVRLVLRETSAAIFSWSAEDATQGTPPSTNLPSPFSTPAAITGLSATSGTADLMTASDGTILTRARVRWNAITDGLALSSGHLELEYKRVGDPAYQKDADIATGATEQYIGALQDGGLYIIRMRAVGGLGIPGDWTSITHSVIGKTAPPANVGALDFTNTILSWLAVTDLDRRGYIVRYQPGAATDWASAFPAHSAGYITETQFDTSILAGDVTTMLVKAVDTSGNESTTAASLMIDLRPPVPTTFLVSVQPDGTREFTWAPVPVADLDGVHIRYYLGSTSDWNAMAPMHSGTLLASPFESNQLAAGTYTFALKAVDLAGNESATALFITTTIGDPRVAGSVADVIEQPYWVGAKTDCHIN